MFWSDVQPAKWMEWKTAHTNEPMTLEAGYKGSVGFYAAEEAWAHDIALGPLKFTEAPVQGFYYPRLRIRNPPAQTHMYILGLAAMSRLDIIIDGRHNLAYLRPKTTPPLPFVYNHLGAGFIHWI